MNSTYFLLGIDHILDVYAYDHMLFLAVLIAGVALRDWKWIIGLITAFTVGHMLTLTFTILQAPLLPSDWVEFLIPITIILTATSNVFIPNMHQHINLSVTVLFGMIHGMGFAGYLQSLLGGQSNIWQPLLCFNLGVELGQVIFAGVLIFALFLLQQWSRPLAQSAQKAISVVGLVISLFLAITNWNF